MKTVIKLLASILFTLPSVLQAQQVDFTIAGKVGKFSSPYKAYLGFYRGGWKVDSAEIKNGFFTFADHVKDPRSGYLYIRHEGSIISTLEKGYKEFYIEPGAITISSPDSLQNVTISAGKLNKDFTDLHQVIDPIDQKYGASIDKSGRFQWDKEKKTAWNNFIKTHPDSYISLYAIGYYSGAIKSATDITDLDELYQLLTPEVQETNLGKIYRSVIAHEKLRGIGAIAPDFSQPDTTGRLVSLHDYKGRYLFIDFWASWCGPCRQENPSVVREYTNYKDKGLSILSISLDNDRNSWKTAIKEDHLGWAQISDLKGGENSVAQLFFIDAIPQNVLVDPNGRIIAKNLSGEALHDKLEEVFKIK